MDETPTNKPADWEQKTYIENNVPEDYAKLTIDDLIENAPDKTVMNVFNNLYTRFTGSRVKELEDTNAYFRESGLPVDETAVKFEKKILKNINELVKSYQDKGLFSNEEVELFQDLNKYRENGLGNLEFGVITKDEADIQYKSALFTLNLYKDLRSQGYSHEQLWS